MNEDGSYTVVWKSAKIDNTLNPTWVPAKIPMTTLCNGDLQRPLRIEVVDWESSGKHQPMGQVLHANTLRVCCCFSYRVHLLCLLEAVKRCIYGAFLQKLSFCSKHIVLNL